MIYSTGFNYIKQPDNENVTAQIAKDISVWTAEQKELALIIIASVNCRDNWSEIKEQILEGFNHELKSSH